MSRCTYGDCKSSATRHGYCEQHWEQKRIDANLAGAVYEPPSFSREALREVALVILWMLAAFALALFLVAKCEAKPAQLSLEEWTLRAASSLPVYYEDNPPGGVAGKTLEKEAQIAALAKAVAAVSRKAPLPPRQWAAVLLTTGFHESTFSLRIARGSCRKHECDGGRARGVFQERRLAAMTPETWARMVGVDNIETQVAEADYLLRRHLHTCAGDPVASVFTGYTGRRCGSEWKGLSERMATFRRLRP